MSYTIKRKRLTTATLITAEKAADILGLSAKTLYNRGAGTEKLTRVPMGARAVRFVQQEVEDLRDKLIQRGQRQAGAPLPHSTNKPGPRKNPWQTNTLPVKRRVW